MNALLDYVIAAHVTH